MIITALTLFLTAAPEARALFDRDGHVSLQHGVLSPPQSGDLRTAAQRFALERRTQLGLTPASTLVPAQALSTRLGGSVHLEQRIVGVPVYGATVVVTFDAERRVVRLASSVRSETHLKLDWAVSGAEALATAAQQIEGALLKGDGLPYGGYQKLIFASGSELRAGWLVWVPTLSNHENWHVAIDAADGRELFRQNRVLYGNQAKVYASDPGGPSQGVGVAPLSDVTLGGFPAEWDAGTLEGEHVYSLNCCPTAGCDTTPGAVARRATGSFMTFQGTVSYDVAICDRRHRASNDPASHATGDFVYAPVDPPTTAAPSVTSLADYDEFAEVHAYHHVNKVYDNMLALSTGPFATGAGLTRFQMRDEARGRQPAVWVNASDPDFFNATRGDGGTIISNALARTENAMFVMREQMEALAVPEYAFDTDALIIYQGDHADFAYDGPVVWHEFGHGVIHSTANWDFTVAMDSRSANVESVALHEGNADVISAITGNRSLIGGYVGPRTAPGTLGIRDLNNSFKCPDVLWGESHQDSQHYTGAIWQARSTLFQGADEGKTFDAAYYAALVSFPKDVDFEKAAAIVSASVGQAFGGIADAEAKMKEIFDARGVTKCSKVLDITNDMRPREYYGVVGGATAGLAMGSLVPGPYQLKIHVPMGAKSVTVFGPYFGGGGGSGTARVTLLAKADAPVTFTRSGTSIGNDADVSVVPTLANGMMNGKASIAVKCGGDLFFTLANSSQRDRVLQNVSFQFEPADACPIEMPPEPDPVVVASASDVLGEETRAACGCGASGAFPALALALALLAMSRRRRSSR